MKTHVIAMFSLVLGASSLSPTAAVANDESGAMNRCLAAWGDHPFGIDVRESFRYRTGLR